MTSIPPNIAGSILQTQVSAAQTARSDDAQRNKRASDSRELARLANQTISEVEDTDQTEEVIVRRQDDRRRDGQDARDTYESHQKSNSDKASYSRDEQDEDADRQESSPQEGTDFQETPDSQSNSDSDKGPADSKDDSEPTPPHIDLSA